MLSRSTIMATAITIITLAVLLRVETTRKLILG